MPTDLHQALAQMKPKDWKCLLALAGRKFGPAGLEAGELVNEAVALLLEGRRRWRPEVSIRTFLWQTVRSLGSHALERPARQRTQSLETCEISVEIALADTAPDADFEHDLACFRASLADDPRLQVLLDGLLAGYSQTEIARQLELSNARVTALKQELIRRLYRFFG